MFKNVINFESSSYILVQKYFVKIFIQLEIVESLVENEENFSKKEPGKLKNIMICYFLKNKLKIKHPNVDKKGDIVENKSQALNVLNFRKLSEKACLPKRATAGSAGMDLCACIDGDITIMPSQRVLIPCGISLELPNSDYAAFIFARSGLAIKYGVSLSNGVGVIDSDYRGEICVGLYNSSEKEYTVNPGERIAQMVIMKVENLPIFEVKELNDTQRGEGGFGSTGKL